MEKQQNQNHHNPDKKNSHHQTWGTWEELLLACAVKRHGFKDWDTVAMEVQNRTTLPQLLTTARNCEQKFHDLKRRFTAQCNDVVLEPQENGAPLGDTVDHVPWLDELRKLRVAELRQEVQRSDVSILSLQRKVKRLEEEREQSLKENGGERDEKPDLADSGKPENDEKNGEEEETEPTNSEPGKRLDDEDNSNNNSKLPTGDESDRENQSVNESNSTGSKSDEGKTGEEDMKLEPSPVHSGPKEPDPVGRRPKPVREESNNGSYDTAAKVPTCGSLPPSEDRKVEDSSELRDSVAHSRDEGEGGTRESSEVQSSASLTRKRKTRRRKKVSGGGDGGEETPENDEVAVKSQPLVGVLELIKGHEHSSLFERLESQESDRYKNIVRQHVDLETIQTRLQKGSYSSCTHAFFRDLLLLFNNATVFFPKDSIESTTAKQLRRLVSVEFMNRIQSQPDPLPQNPDSSLLPPNNPPPPSQAKPPDSLLSKHKATAPILVCRKRTSVSAKPSSAPTFGQKGEQILRHEKKPTSVPKQPLKPSSSSDTDEEPPPKAKEKPVTVTGARSLRRSNKNLISGGSNPNNNKKLQSGSSTPKASSPKPDNKSKADASDKKRSAAADFLKRIKRNGPAESLRSGSGGGGSSSRGGVSGKEQKKVMSSGKGDNKGKERVLRNSGGGSGDKKKENIESSGQSKRSVGRPPKRAAETHAAVSAKRGRESSSGKDKRPRKRTRK